MADTDSQPSGRAKTGKPSEAGEAQAVLLQQVERQEARKLRARRRGRRAVWFGLGMFGIVGWSVAVPTLAGVGLGLWIDGQWPGRFSWTLMLLCGGLFLGCLNAWYWINRQRELLESEEEQADDG